MSRWFWLSLVLFLSVGVVKADGLHHHPHEHPDQPEPPDCPGSPECPDPPDPPDPPEGGWDHLGEPDRDGVGWVQWEKQYGDTHSREVLNVFKPDGDYSGDLVFWVHGSGWGGTKWANKDTMNSLCKYYAKEYDAACVTISHPYEEDGWRPEHLRPHEQMAYVLKAYRWAEDNVPYARIHANGHSSGSHMLNMHFSDGTIKPDTIIHWDSGGYQINPAYPFMFEAWRGTDRDYRRDNSPTNVVDSSISFAPHLHIWIDQVWRATLEWEIDRYMDEADNGTKWEYNGQLGHMFFWTDATDPTTDVHDMAIEHMGLQGER